MSSWKTARLLIAPSVSPLTIGAANFVLVYLSTADSFGIDVYSVTSILVFLALADQVADFGRRLKILKKTNQFDANLGLYQLISLFGVLALYLPFNLLVPEAMAIDIAVVFAAALSSNLSLPSIILRRNQAYYLDAVAVGVARLSLLAMVLFGYELAASFLTSHVICYAMSLAMLNVGRLKAARNAEPQFREAAKLENISLPNYLSQTISVLFNRAPLVTAAYIVSASVYSGLALAYSCMGIASILYLGGVARLYTSGDLISFSRHSAINLTIAFYAAVYLAAVLVILPLTISAGLLRTQEIFSSLELTLLCCACSAQSINHLLRFQAMSQPSGVLERDNKICCLAIAALFCIVVTCLFFKGNESLILSSVEFLVGWLLIELALIRARWR